MERTGHSKAFRPPTSDLRPRKVVGLISRNLPVPQAWYPTPVFCDLRLLYSPLSHIPLLSALRPEPALWPSKKQPPRKPIPQSLLRRDLGFLVGPAMQKLRLLIAASYRGIIP